MLSVCLKITLNLFILSYASYGAWFYYFLLRAFSGKRREVRLRRGSVYDSLWNCGVFLLYYLKNNNYLLLKKI